MEPLFISGKSNRFAFRVSKTFVFNRERRFSLELEKGMGNRQGMRGMLACKGNSHAWLDDHTHALYKLYDSFARSLCSNIGLLARGKKECFCFPKRPLQWPTNQHDGVIIAALGQEE